MRPNLFLFVMVALLPYSQLVQAAGFGINATRLIFPQDAGNISISVRNTQPALSYLVQTSLSRTQHSHEPTPFTVTPPLFRLEPHSVNQLRITGDGATLPKDRESVFYFHASAIPAGKTPAANQPTAGVQGAVQFGVGKIIKLFYRPTDLPSTSAAAQMNLQFARTNTGLRISNPSPYFVSLAGLSFAGQEIKLETSEALMLAPFGDHTYVTPVKRGAIEWLTINDHGGVDAFKHSLP
ncbi:TPA: molecular chaperone [Serratia fonticola]